VLPWSLIWERNFFIERYPWIEAVATSLYVRGAISGLGVINVLAGFADLVPIFSLRARHDVAFGDEADTQVRP
jgi:hypothetical protein